MRNATATGHLEYNEQLHGHFVANLCAQLGTLDGNLRFVKSQCQLCKAAKSCYGFIGINIQPVELGLKVVPNCLYQVTNVFFAA